MGATTPIIEATEPVRISRQGGAAEWYSDLQHSLPSSPVFLERMQLRRAQFSGASQGGYSRTTGDLLRHGTVDEAAAGMADWREQNRRPEWGYRLGWSERRCDSRGIGVSPERALDSQERAVRGLQSDALYFGLGATAGARPLFAYLRTGELNLPEPQPGDAPIASGAVASAVNARLQGASYGVATATRDRIFTRAAPRNVSGARFSFDALSPREFGPAG